MEIVETRKIPNGKLVTIVAFSNYISANIAANYLHEHGIDCFLADEYSAMAAIAPIAVEIRMMVSEKDLNQAKNLLDSYLKK